MAIALLGVRQGRVYYGYCPTTQSYLSLDQGYRAALAYALRYFPPRLSVKPPGYSQYKYPFAEKIPAYGSVDQFLGAYPNCCTIVSRGWEGWRPSLFDRLTGRTFGVVAIEHLATYSLDGQLMQATSTEFVPISACGKAHPEFD
jgi:hypothetical protein